MRFPSKEVTDYIVYTYRNTSNIFIEKASTRSDYRKIQNIYKQASTRSESSYEVEQLRRPQIGNRYQGIYYYEILLASKLVELFRESGCHTARDRWVVVYAQPFFLFFLK